MSNMTIETSGLQELSVDEINEVSGAVIPLLGYVLIRVAISGAIYVAVNW